MIRNACEPGAHTYTTKCTHTRKSYCCPFVVLLCECAQWAGSALFISSHHSATPLPPKSSSFLPSFVSDRLFLSSFNSHFLTPRTHSSILSSISPLPSCFYLVCALVCHEQGGGWLVAGGLDGHLILALSHNVGMCYLFKIWFPRWVLSMQDEHDHDSLHNCPCVCFFSLCVSCVLLLYLNILETQVRWVCSINPENLQNITVVHVNQHMTVNRQAALEWPWVKRQVKVKTGKEEGI